MKRQDFWRVPHFFRDMESDLDDEEECSICSAVLKPTSQLFQPAVWDLQSRTPLHGFLHLSTPDLFIFHGMEDMEVCQVHRVIASTGGGPSLFGYLWGHGRRHRPGTRHPNAECDCWRKVPGRRVGNDAGP